MAGWKVGGFLAAAGFLMLGWGCGSGSGGSDADDGDVVGDPLTEDFFLTDCPAGTAACGGACVDTSADHANCGGCGNACLAAEVCNEGSCDLECPSGRTNCFGSCVDLETDFLHCGGCSSPCASGEACVAGVCGPDCIADGSGLPCASGADCCSGNCETYYEDTDGDTYGLLRRRTGRRVLRLRLQRHGDKMRHLLRDGGRPGRQLGLLAEEHVPVRRRLDELRRRRLRPVRA